MSHFDFDTCFEIQRSFLQIQQPTLSFAQAQKPLSTLLRSRRLSLRTYESVVTSLHVNRMKTLNVNHTLVGKRHWLKDVKRVSLSDHKADFVHLKVAPNKTKTWEYCKKENGTPLDGTKLSLVYVCFTKTLNEMAIVSYLAPYELSSCYHSIGFPPKNQAHFNHLGCCTSFGWQKLQWPVGFSQLLFCGQRLV